MAKDRYTNEAEEMEIESVQDRICDKVRRIRCLQLLEKLEDMVSRIYRRGAR